MRSTASHQDEIRRLEEEKAQVETELTDKQAECEKLDKQIEQKADQVKAILNYIPAYEKEFQIEDECEQLCEELTSLLNGKLSIMKHSDEIISKAQRLSKDHEEAQQQHSQIRRYSIRPP